MQTYEKHDIEKDGTTYRVEFAYDDCADTPWEMCEWHGVVSDWTRRSKRPGERVLSHCRGDFRYYDVQKTREIAKRDGWNVAPFDAPDAAGRAVEADFKRLKAWCCYDWHYSRVTVFPLSADGYELRSKSHSLGAVESDCADMGTIIDDLITEIEGE